MFLSPDGKAARTIITHDVDPATPEGISHIDAMRHSAQEAVNGYTKHAEDQIAGCDGGIGVRRDALEDAFNHPVRDVERLVDSQGRVSYRYTGENATVVVNEQGKVITGWANNSTGTAGGAGG